MAATTLAHGRQQDLAAREVKTMRSSPAKGKPAEKDGDVELIAALLNRVSAKAEPAGEEALRRAGAGGTQQRATAAEQKKNRKTAGMRESAASRPVDSTELQLKRCASLGFFESEMCRFRVCSGRWGSDPACPDSAQVSAVVP
jgi:hypothetical protein